MGTNSIFMVPVRVYTGTFSYSVCGQGSGKFGWRSCESAPRQGRAKGACLWRWERALIFRVLRVDTR